MQTQVLEGFRLSPQQRFLWSGQQESSAYHAACAILLEGELDKNALRGAIRSIVNRHEILRTGFRRLPGMEIPIQVVSIEDEYSWREVDLSHCRGGKRVRVCKLFEEEKARRLNVEDAAMLRASLLILSPREHVLIINLPSLCADAWTLKKLVQEISAFYGECAHDPGEYDEPIRYAHFSEWQNEMVEAADREEVASGDLSDDLIAFASVRLPFENRATGLNDFKPGFLPDYLGRPVPHPPLPAAPVP